MDDNKDIAVFRQVCEVNELDPEQIRKMAQQQKSSSPAGTSEAELLITTAFNVKAKKVVQGLSLGTTSDSENIKAGEEYAINPDPSAPSFTINEDFIHAKYSESEAEKLIEALGKVMLPVTG